MDLIEHFSTYENIPVKLSDVAAHVVETSRVDRLVRYAVDVNTDIIRGLYREYHHKPPYAPGGQVVGEVIYSKHLDIAEARMVQCKEMLHAFDEDSSMAAKIEQVAQLAIDIVSPFKAFRTPPSPQFISDVGTQIVAIAILVPIGFIDLIKPIYDADRISVQQIAQATQMPASNVRFALRDDWNDLIEPFM